MLRIRIKRQPRRADRDQPPAWHLGPSYGVGSGGQLFELQRERRRRVRRRPGYLNRLGGLRRLLPRNLAAVQRGGQNIRGAAVQFGHVGESLVSAVGANVLDNRAVWNIRFRLRPWDAGFFVEVGCSNRLVERERQAK